MKWTKTKSDKVKALFSQGLQRQKIAEELGISYGSLNSFLGRVKWQREPSYTTARATKLNNGERKDLQREIHEKDQQVKELMKRDQVHIQDFYGKVFKFGVISDTHYGSLHEKKPELYSAYQYFHKEGVKIVYHCGDLVEGEKVYRGQEYERYISGFDNLVQNVVDEYPKNGITTYFITGSHDLSYYKIAGVDIGKRIAAQRPDMIYLGPDSADIQIAPNIIIRLVHPGGGTAYAISYQVQKYIESLSGGQKPTICLFGHYHKAEYLPCYRNVFSFQAGCFQGQTQFMKRKNLAAHMGFWIVEAFINKERLVSKVKAEFIAFYEQPKIHTPQPPTQ